MLGKGFLFGILQTYCLGAGELSDEWSLPGTLWNLSSHDSIKMEIVDHALHALTDEVIIPHSGWEREPGEDCKPRHIEWESVLTNTAGCLRYQEGWERVKTELLKTNLSCFQSTFKSRSLSSRLHSCLYCVP